MTAALESGHEPRGGFRLGVLLAIVTFIMLGSLSLANITTKGPAKRGLANGVAILTEVDALLEVEFPQLEERAAATSPDERVMLTDFPIAVSFTPSEVLSRTQVEFRELLLERSADQLYDGGASTFRTGSGGSSGLLSKQGILERGMDILRPTPHRIFLTFTIVLAVIASGLAIAAALAAPAQGRLTAVSLSVLLGSLAFLAASSGVRLVIWIAASSTNDYLWTELLGLCQELAWAPVRNSLVMTAASALAFVTGLTLRGSRPNESY